MLDADGIAMPTKVRHAEAHETYIEKWQQVLVAVAQEKYMQEWPRDGDRAVSQTIVSTTPEVSVVVPTRNEQDNIWPPMRRKNFYDKFPSVAAVAGVHLAGSLLSVSRPRGLLGLAGRPT